jgi:hypothetical protein
MGGWLLLFSVLIKIRVDVMIQPRFMEA